MSNIIRYETTKNNLYQMDISHLSLALVLFETAFLSLQKIVEANLLEMV